MTKADRRQLEVMAKVLRRQLEPEIRTGTMECVMVVALMTLRDEYGFGQSRLERFMTRFMTKIECIDYDYVQVRDMARTLRDECGVIIELHGMEDDHDNN